MSDNGRKGGEASHLLDLGRRMVRVQVVEDRSSGLNVVGHAHLNFAGAKQS